VVSETSSSRMHRISFSGLPSRVTLTMGRTNLIRSCQRQAEREAVVDNVPFTWLRNPLHIVKAERVDLLTGARYIPI
jgi:hypothetical protein